MSDEKIYSAEEAAKKILEKCQDLYNNSKLAKSVNTSHVIELGEEPRNDDAECPESLSGEGTAPEPTKRDEVGEESEEDKAKKLDKESEGIEHEESMEEDEELIHDAMENKEDEIDEDIIEADEEAFNADEKAEINLEEAGEESEEEEEEEEEKEERTRKSESKLGEFLAKREAKKACLEKAKIFDIKTKEKVADLPSTIDWDGNSEYKPKEEKKAPAKWLRDQKRYKEQVDAGKNPAKRLRDKKLKEKGLGEKTKKVDKSASFKEAKPALPKENAPKAPKKEAKGPSLKDDKIGAKIKETEIKGY